MDLDLLIKSCINQNRKAQEELYNLYRSKLYSLSLKYCANKIEAEDNLQNSFVEIFINLKKYKNKGSFEGWMKRIVINKAIDTYKKKHKLVPLKEEYTSNQTADTDVTEEEMDVPLNYLLQIIQELPDQYRLVFCLYELDSFSHQEISRLLSISINTSKSNLHRAKTILKSKILLKTQSYLTTNEK